MLLDTRAGTGHAHIPPPDAGSIEQAMVLANKRSIELGWTQIHDAGGGIAKSSCSKNSTAKAS